MQATLYDRTGRFVLVILVALGLAVPSLATTAAAAPPTAQLVPKQLSVSGDRIVDQHGTAVQLGGVNRAGAEYACAQGWGIFDGPTDAASIAAIRSWGANAVRVPLNEHCWLGRNGVNPQYGGAAYRSAIAGFVRRIEAQGLKVILDLHWTHHGTNLALGQQKMPNADHSLDFWRSMAKRFGSDRAIVFDLFNEMHDVSWECWRSGCQVDGYQGVGMQQLVTVVRRAGAQNVLLVNGNGWAGDISQWAAFAPNDPLDRLAAGWHLYDFSACTTVSCWETHLDGVAGQAPVVIGEFGQSDCQHWFVDGLMVWADGYGIGYVAWTWDAWPNCDGPTLILDYSGTPTAYGIGVRDHYLERFGP